MNLHVILISNSESHREKSSVCSISLSARDCVVSEVGSSWLQARLLFLGQKRKQRSASNGFLIISLLQMWWQLSWLSIAENSCIPQLYLWEVSLLFQLFQQFWSIYCPVWNPCLLKTSSNQFCCPQWNAPWWTATSRVNRALDRGPVIAQGNQTYCDLWIKAIYANCHCNSFSHFRNLRNQDVYKHNFLWRNKKSRFLDFIPSRLSQNLWGVDPGIWQLWWVVRFENHCLRKICLSRVNFKVFTTLHFQK